MIPSAHDLVGTTIGPYRLERLLGEGGFAWVFVGRAGDAAPVAVKVLNPRYAGDPNILARFLNEAATAAKLRHPRIIRIHTVERANGHVFIAMDLCADSLAARLARDGPLPETEIMRIAGHVVEGLAFAHDQGVIHRDLKPDNILLHADGSAVISDFGIARALSGYVTATGVGMIIGTPEYLSPEQAQGRPLDPRLDLYGLGITLYKAATGEVPFRSADWFELARMHVEARPPSLRQKRPELSKRFEGVVLRCLAKHPDDRYRDARAMLKDLTEAATSPRGRGEGRPRGLVVAGVVLGLVVTILLVLLIRRR